MRALSVLLVLPVCIVLAACSDGSLCGSAAPGDPVYLEVSYAGGMPAVDPDPCTVKQGTVVTWRGPLFDDTAFSLEFAGLPGTAIVGSQTMAGRANAFGSESQEFRHKVRMTADTTGQFKYDVVANGVRLDPHIIIDR